MSILAMYINLVQNRGQKMAIIKFKNVQWKSPSEKEINKKHLFVQITYWKIYAKKIQTLIFF